MRDGEADCWHKLAWIQNAASVDVSGSTAAEHPLLVVPSLEPLAYVPAQIKDHGRWAGRNARQCRHDVLS